MAKNNANIVKVEVTATDIKKGEAESCLRCPIARAAKRAKLEDPYVDGEFIYFDAGEGHQTIAALPKKARVFAERFDEGKTVKPFSFQVRLEKAS